MSENQPTKSKWISVEERLPGKDIKGCIYFFRGGRTKIYNAQKFDILLQFNFEDETGWFTHEEVTHWQPLPEPPEDIK